MNLLLRKTEDRSKPNRRDFMVQSTCAGLGITSLVNTIAQLKMIGAASTAQAAGGPYKALVCVFLNGGNDSNNLLIPAAGSAASLDYRGNGSSTFGRGQLAIPDASLDFTPTSAANGYWNGSAVSTAAVSSRLTPQNGSPTGSAFDPASRSNYTQGSMALHPGAYPLAQLFEQGELAVMANVGTLVGTTSVTRANFNTLPASAKPPQLFSHSDQQTQWQSSLPDRPFTSGWGGRVADLLSSMNSGDLSMSVSIAGVNSFQVGLVEQPYFMNSSGSVTSLSGYGSPYTSALRNTALQPDYSNPASVASNKYNPLAGLGTGTDPLATTNYQNNAAGWRLRAIEQVLAMSHASLFDQTYDGVPKNARITEGLVGNALALSAAPNPTLDAHFTNWFPSGLFNPQVPDIASQLKTVARMIAGRSALNNNRQIFFVQLGGWDTHTSQIPSNSTTAGHYALINQLSRAMRAFKDAMDSIGMWDSVLAFTASDFNRTFIANKNDSTGGSDHAWGGHSILMGGAVKGRNIYGTFPDLTKGGGIDCTGSSGRWIPSTAVDQYASIIAKWFGVSDAQLSSVFPNLSRFMPNGIGTAELQARNLDMIDFTV